MRIAIYGSGGLGGYYGARLASAGHEVAFIARGAHLAAIQRDGLRVLSPAGDLHLRRVFATSEPREVGQVEAVIVAVKTWQIGEVGLAMQPMLAPQTLVVPFLNGVEAADQLADIVGATHVLGGLSKIFSLIEAPGVIRHFNDAAYVAIGELDDSRTARLARLVEAFASAGVEAEVAPAIRRALWEKFVMVTSWAGLGALSRSPIGVLRAAPATRALIDRAMAESLTLAAARGIDIADDFKNGLWTFYDSLPHAATASLMRDLMAGKPSELEAWSGAVHRFGTESGIPTPVHSMAYHLLAPMEARARA